MMIVILISNNTNEIINDNFCNIENNLSNNFRDNKLKKM